jgi:hypothetical protein
MRYDQEVATVTLTNLLTDETLAITGTLEHPFYVIGKGFVNLGDLEVGDVCIAPDGSEFTVVSVVVHEERQTVYNFEVEGGHTYYVGLDFDSAVLVHNQNKSTKEEIDAIIAQIDSTIAKIATMASDGRNHTLTEAHTAASAWATTTGYRSEKLKDMPWFFQQAVEDIENSMVLTSTSLLVWSLEWIGSNLPNQIFDNTGWDTGNGDVWLRMEAWRLGLLKKRIIVLYKNAQ